MAQLKNQPCMIALDLRAQIPIRTSMNLRENFRITWHLILFNRSNPKSNNRRMQDLRRCPPYLTHSRALTCWRAKCPAEKGLLLRASAKRVKVSLWKWTGTLQIYCWKRVQKRGIWRSQTSRSSTFRRSSCDSALSASVSSLHVRTIAVNADAACSEWTTIAAGLTIASGSATLKSSSSSSSTWPCNASTRWLFTL